MADAQAIYVGGTGVAIEKKEMVLAGSAVVGEIVQYHDGRAGVVMTAKDESSGTLVTLGMTGLWAILATGSISFLRGTRVWFDESANLAHVKQGAAGDFPLGVVDEDATTSSGDRVYVDLNAQPCYTVSTWENDELGAVTQRVLTAGVPEVHNVGGMIELRLDTTTEAQCASWLSGAAHKIGDKGILDLWVQVVTNGDDAAFDAVFGLASDDHASDPDTIAESVFFSINGASTNINAESDDGTTEVAATDTTVDFTAGTTFFAQIDLRDEDDIQLYIDGVNVLPSSEFKIDAATGPLKILGLAEKSSNDSPGQVRFRAGYRRLEDKGAA